MKKYAASYDKLVMFFSNYRSAVRIVTFFTTKTESQNVDIIELV